MRLAKHFGEKIELLPNENVHKLRSADATRNGEVWEWKTTNGSTTSVQKRLRTGSLQSNHILLILASNFDEAEVLRGVISAINSDRSCRILKIDLLLPNNNLVKFTREKIRLRNFDNFFDALK